MAERVLIVEDEVTLRKNLERYLREQGYEVAAFESAEAAAESLAEAGVLGQTRFDVALLDLRLPGKDGLSLASDILLHSPDTMILMMTAYGTVESTVEALHMGIHDYLIKPVLMKDVAHRVARLCEHRRLLRENAALRRRLAERESDLPVARSRATQKLFAFVHQVAPSGSTVLVEGESGSGKEVVARALHEASPRCDCPFVALNMSAIPESLAESQLFGHEQGAFTGADSAQQGVFRAACGGTLLLDEIGEMAAPQQAKLLRALETRDIYPVGSSRPVRIDVRIVAATNSDLHDLVQKGRFRQDLYYRLAAIKVRVPPLRERIDDIPVLAEHFLLRHAKEHQRPVLGFDGAAMQRLLAYSWPGNVRELSNVVEGAVVVCAGTTVTVADLAPELGGRSAGEPDGSHHRAMMDYERVLVRAALDRAGGDRREAARELGLSLATLYRRIEKLGLKVPPPKT